MKGFYTLKRCWSLLVVTIFAFASSFGQTVAKIGTTEYTSVADAVSAATTGQTVSVVEAGTYTLPNIPQNITIEGGVSGVVFSHTSAGNIASVPNGCTFSNVSFELGNQNYHGFQHAGTINMNGCTLNGKLFSYGPMFFTNCTFTQSNPDYHMWVYGGDCTYTNCTFTNSATGKFLHLYNESGATLYTVTVTNCTFNNTSGKASKAAINVKAACNSTQLQYALIVDDASTTTGAFPEASTTSTTVVLSPLVMVDDKVDIATEQITITVDNNVVYTNGEEVVAGTPVAKIGSTEYTSLQAAVDAATSDMTGDVTIELIDDITGYTIVHQKAGLNLTIDGNNKARTIAGEIIIDGDGRADGTETLTITGIKFEGDKTNFYTGLDAFVVVPSTKTSGTPYYTNKYNYAHNVTISNCSFTSTSSSLDVVGFKSTSAATCYNLVVSDVTGTNLHSFAQLTATEGVTFTNCSAADSKSFVGVNGGGRTYSFTGCSFSSSEADNYAIRIKSGNTATVTMADNTLSANTAIQIGSGATVNVTSGTYVGDIVKTAGTLAISGGHFSADLEANPEFLAEGYIGKNGIYATETPTAPNGVAACVAKINSTYYTTLQAAVAAVPTDGMETTITMLANDTISTNAGVIIAAGKNIVLELNGKAIVQNAPDASAGYLIRNNGTLTITDNTDTNNDGTGTGRLETNVTTPWVYSTADPNGYATNLISNYGTLTINSGYLVNNGMGSACYAVDNYQSGSVTVNGGALVTVRSSAIRMFYNNGGSLAVTGGIIGGENTYMGVQVQSISTNGVNVNLTGGTFNGDYAVYAGGGTNWATSNISISGGTYNGYVGFTGTLTNVSVSDGFFNAWCGSWGDVKFISGGRFADPVDEAFCAEGYIPATLDVETNKYTVKLGSYVAQIGSTKYETLAEAIAAVPTDGTETTITMLADEAVEAGVTIAAGKNVVLELAGHTISGNTSSTTTYALITNRGTLTIQDSTDVNLDGTGNGLITTYISDPDQGDVPGYASNTITNNGTLTVKSGKIVNNGSGYACYAIDNQTNGTAYTPVLNIEGGCMEQMNARTYAVRMFCNSTTNANTVNISGGVITGGYGLWLQTPNNKANVANLNISGGTLESRDGAALYVGGTKADNSNISINITDGTIGGTGVIIQGPLTGTYGSLSISGGYIDNVQCGANVESFISGGIYNNPVQDAYAAEFYVPCDYNNGTYGVTLLEANERDYIFIDGDEGYEQYGITAPTEVKSATYRRSFDSQRVDNYQAWFLPFDYTITAEDVEKFDFYKIHMIANAPQAGVNEPSDQIWIYLNAIGEGTVLYANKPYVYVPKEEIDSYNFVTEGATLKAPLTTSPLSVETAENTYSFYGTYAATSTTTEDQFYYLSITGGLSQGQQSGITVGPYRWILRVNSKNIIDYAPSIGFMVEDDVTGINAVGGEGLNGVTYFTVDGKRVSKPGKGVYIVRSADGSTKKVLFK